MDDADHINRIEFGLMIDRELTNVEMNNIASGISGLVHYPWDHYSLFAEGHTTNFYGMESFGFSSVLITQKNDDYPQLDLGTYRNEKVNFYWLVPLKEEERKIMMQ